MAARRFESRIPLAASAFCIALLAPRAARALDVEVSSSTAAQGYSLRSSFGEPILMRRRFVQTLGMSVTNIGGEAFDPKGPWVSFRLRMRLDADFGVHGDETNWATYPGGYVPGLATAPVDLMYGYLDARNLAGGILSMRLGRQYIVDPLGWWSFDGAMTRVELPVYLAFETYAGFEQRGGLPWSTPRFERDGVWRGDRTGLDGNVYPDFQQSHLAPAAGVVLESWGLPVVHGRVAYRKVWNTGSVVTRPLPATSTSPLPVWDGWRVSSERFGASLDADDDDLGAVRTGAVYDLVASRFTSAYAGLDAFASERITLGGDADRVVPSFDADSIWNWFAIEPSTTATVRADVRLTDQLDTGLSGGARWVDTSAISATGSSASEQPSTAIDGLGRLSARYRFDVASLGAAGSLDLGDRGRREGVDLFGDRTFEDRYIVNARASLYEWRDDWRPERSATSFSYVVGGGYRVGELSEVLVEWEHATNRLVGQRYRVLAVLNLSVTP